MTPKPLRNLIVVANVALLLLAVHGCATTKVSPVRKVTIAQQTYAAAVNTLTDLRKQGKVSDADAIRLEAVMIGADKAMALARTKAVAGDKVGTDAAIAAVLSAAVEIDAFIREHQ